MRYDELANLLPDTERDRKVYASRAGSIASPWVELGRVLREEIRPEHDRWSEADKAAVQDAVQAAGDLRSALEAHRPTEALFASVDLSALLAGGIPSVTFSPGPLAEGVVISGD